MARRDIRSRPEVKDAPATDGSDLEPHRLSGLQQCQPLGEPDRGEGARELGATLWYQTVSPVT